VDTLDEAGIYFCMTGGQVYVVTDSGDIWAPIARDLPAVLSNDGPGRRIMVHVSTSEPVSGPDPLISHRTFLVTGGNTGIGLATASDLAKGGANVYIACRDPDRGRAAVAAIRAAASDQGGTVDLLQLDLTALNSVRACAESFLAKDEPLHVLVNNAGLAGGRGQTADGFETTFGVNHLGHFALTMLLLDRLKASGPGSRVLSVASDAHYTATGIDWNALKQKTKSFTGMREYAVSKLCNVLFAQELARRLGGADADVTTYALHPGVVASDIWRRIPWPIRPLMTRRMISTGEGAVTSLYCATSAEVAGQSGLYYDKCRAVDPNPVATPELAEQLWKYSTEWTGVG
jgi:retinol dehydrogenase-12